MFAPNKRRDTDVMKLMMSDFGVQLGGDALAAPQSDFYVRFPGPVASPYEGGIWRVHVILPAQYPFKSPSIGFCNTIFHPNVDEASGSVCLDVINQTWSPMFDLTNVFTVFLPQLLLYPNASDPLNAVAATLALRDKAAYEAKVREYVAKFASKDFKLGGDDDDDTVDAPSSRRRTTSSSSSSAASSRALGAGSPPTGGAGGVAHLGGGGGGWTRAGSSPSAAAAASSSSSSSSSSSGGGGGALTSSSSGEDDKGESMDEEEEELSDVDDEASEELPECEI